MNIRLKLDDVIDSNLIMSLLLETIEKMPTKKVLFWHNGDISTNDIDEFFTKWRDETSVSLEICEDPTFKCAWFDIISQKDNRKLNTSHRFKYIYSTKDDIMKGIFNYYHTANFIRAPKKRPHKKRPHKKRK